MIEMLRIRRNVDANDDHRAHRDLADAIADRDAETAERASRTHLTGLKVGLE